MAATSFTVFGIGGCNCPAPPSCSVIFTVTGCNSLAVSGVTVNVYTSMGGTLLDSGTTNTSGQVTLTWTGASGSYYVTITGASARFASYAQTLALTCSGSKSISLTPATGYECFVGCALPIATTLHMTDNSILGGPVTCTLTSTGGNWVGSTSVAFPGTRCTGLSCAAATISLTYTLTPSGGLSVAYTVGTGLGSGCPTATGTAHTTTFSGGPAATCPPSFFKKITVLGGCPTTDVAGFALYGCPGSCTGDIEFTE